MKWAILLLAVSSSWAGIGTPVLLDLTDRSTVTRTGNIVLAGVPIPETSAVTDVRNLAITTAPSNACTGGVNIDSHRLVTERWHGDPTDSAKNIKWVLVAISAPTLAGSAVAHVCLSDRSGADPGTATVVTINSSDTCTDSTACTTISTGVNKYWIRHDYFNLFDQVRRISDSHDYVTHSTSGGIAAVTSAGTFTSATAPTATPGIPGYTVTTEEPTGSSSVNEDGANLWAQVKVSGALWNGTTPKFTYVGRLFFFGGDGMWLWKGTNIYSEDMFATANQPTSVGLFIPTTFGASLTATFGTVYGAEGTTSAVSMANTDDVWLSQYDHGNTVSNTAPMIGGTSSIGAPWYVCNDVGAQNTATAASGENDCGGLNLSGFRIVKGTTTQSTGSQSDGWMGLDDGTNQANVWMRDNWQNYPMEIEAAGGTIAIYQWPKHGDTHVDGNANGDLTMIFNYKRDMALANQTGFGHLWPWAPGAAMNMTPLSPNPGRGFFSLISQNAGQPVVLSGYGVNSKLNDSPCNGAGCNFWTVCTLSGGVCTFDATKARKVYISGFTGTWAPMNGYRLAMWNGSTTPNGTNNWPQLAIFNDDGTVADASGFGTIPAGCLGSPGACRVGTMDTMGDSQVDSFGRSWEIAGNFTSHGSATPGNDAARWRDTLLFTNPTYYCDTSLVMGHVHKQDATNFARSENEITNYFNNLYKRDVVLNVYGIYYGFPLYGNPPAGFGQRYWAALSRRKYDIGYWLQFMRTADPMFFHRGHAFIQATEAETQHPPQVNVTSAYAGVGLDHTGTASSNVFWDSKHYIDANNNLVAKHDGSLRCTEGWGGSVWFPVYNASPGALTGGGASVNACSDGQQPWLDYPTTSLRLNYDLAGDPRSKDLVQSVVKNAIFSATTGESTNLRTLILDEGSNIYSGGAFGRAFGGCVQAGTDAAELLGNGTVNYIDFADSCFKANMQDESGINVWSQNPTGILYDDASIGPKSSTPSTNAHTHYGSHYFATSWAYWSFPEYVSYKGNVAISAPSYAVGHASQNVQTALNNMSNGVLGYFNPATKSGGLYTYLFPARIISDSYALTSDAEALKYIKRTFDFQANGADDAVQSTGCTQTGSALLVGDTPSVPPTPICTSPVALAGVPPFALNTTTNPNGVSTSTPDVHDGGLLSIGLPYLEYSLVGQNPAKPNTPPSFVLVPAAGAANAPLTWITNNTGGGGFTFDLFLRISVSLDFGNLSIVTPISGDFSLTVIDPSGNPVSGISVGDSAGDTYTGSPTAVFKTPTQMWPPAAGGGTGACLTAPAPPSINFTADGLNNKDNRDFLVTVPAGAPGEYKIQLTFATCSDPNGVQIPVAALLSMSTGNVSLATCTSPCSAISQFIAAETGSVQYANIGSGVSKFQADSAFRFAVIDPSNDLYRGSTTKTILPATGQWAIMQNGGWIAESSYPLTFGGVGGVKPLASPSPAYFYDSPNYSNQTFVSNVNNPIALTFSGCTVTTASPLHSGTTNTVYSPTVQQTTSGCGAGTPNWSMSGSLPPGMALSSGGVVSGTPTANGTYNFTASVTGLASTPSPSPESVTINNPMTCNSPSITSTSPLPAGTSGNSYSYTFTATGDPTITWSATGLPGWATLNAATGVLSGVAAAGTSAISVTATNGCGSAGPSGFTLQVNAPSAVTIHASGLSASQVQ